MCHNHDNLNLDTDLMSKASIWKHLPVEEHSIDQEGMIIVATDAALT